MRAKQAQGIYKPEEVEAFLSSVRERLALRDWLEQREGSQRENAGYANGFGEWGNFEGEHVRGDAEGEVDFKSYPRLKGESPQQYGERLKTMRYLMNAAEEDVDAAVSELQGALAALVKAAPAAGGSTAAGSYGTSEDKATGAGSAERVSISAKNPAVETGDAGNLAATASVMLGALAAAGLAAGFLSRKKEQ